MDKKLTLNKVAKKMNIEWKIIARWQKKITAFSLYANISINHVLLRNFLNFR